MGLKWKRGNVTSKLGKKTLSGGTDTDESTIYVGRAIHAGVCLPAKIIPSKRACYVSYNGAEVFVESFEVLEAKEKYISWVPGNDGRVPAGAVSTGKDGNDEIYIGRAPHQGSMTVGKIHPSHGCLYLPFNGQEVRLSCYEVLTYTKKSKKSKEPKSRSRKSSASSSSSSD